MAIQNTSSTSTANTNGTPLPTETDNNSNMLLRINVRFTSKCLIASLLTASISILLLARTTYSNEQQARKYQSPALRPKSTSTTEINGLELKEFPKLYPITSSEVTVVDGDGTNKSTFSLPFLHCGETKKNNKSNAEVSELLLLHGAAFTKKDWETSGILKSFCTIHTSADGTPRYSNPPPSVTALDLSVKSTGEELYASFLALKEAGVISGKPLVIVSPSASGKAMVELGRYFSSSSSSSNSKSTYLSKMVKAWIPVASPAVTSPKTKESDLTAYKSAKIPVLAINGDKDTRGKLVTKRLGEVSGATEVELKGGHPTYLDSPDDFVRTVLNFLDKLYAP